MKKFLTLTLLLLTLLGFTQPTFDSAAYTQFYTARWQGPDFGSLRNAATPAALSTEEKLAGLAKAWAEASYNFANFDLVPTLNWDSLYTAFIPQVMAAKTTFDYYRTLQVFYRHLRDGHTSINLPFAYRGSLNGRLPLQVRWIENRAIVVENKSSRAVEKKIRPGDELVAINGQPLAAYVQQHVGPYLHFSTPQDSIDRLYRYELFRAKGGAEWQLRFKTASGAEVEQAFAFQPVDLFRFPLPLLTFTVLPGNVGYVQLNSFGDDKIVAQFDSIFPALSQTAALIIDLRANGGGNGGNGFEILGYLTDKPFFTGKTLIRQYRPVGRSWGGVEKGAVEEDNWKPYKGKLYSKPVVVLTAAATYSAAEDFTSAFKGMKRGAVIGEPTGGSTGQPVFFTLPGGGLGAVCAKRDYFSDGTEFVGRGIQPDVLIRPTVKGVTAGKDEVLEAALDSLQQKRKTKTVEKRR